MFAKIDILGKRHLLAHNHNLIQFQLATINPFFSLHHQQQLSLFIFHDFHVRIYPFAAKRKTRLEHKKIPPFFSLHKRGDKFYFHFYFPLLFPSIFFCFIPLWYLLSLALPYNGTRRRERERSIAPDTRRFGEGAEKSF
jgi:hypothetical protein